MPFKRWIGIVACGAILLQGSGCNDSVFLGERIVTERDGGDGGTLPGADGAAGSDDATDASDDTAGSLASWGAYTATLALPTCPPGERLLVNTAEDSPVAANLSDVGAAGPTLSLREALIIANNRGVAATVLFDETIFPVDDPVSIALICESALEVNDVCLDGRGRGVIIDGSSCDTGNTRGSQIAVRDKSLVVGLSFVALPWPLHVTDATVAGCRLNTDGYAPQSGAAFFTARASDGAIIGPDNVFAGGWNIDIVGPSSLLRGNYFGFDPLTGEAFGAGPIIDVDSARQVLPVTIEDNVFAVSSSLFWSGIDSTGGPVVFRHNYVGVDRSGRPLPGTWRGISNIRQGTYVIGPGNHVQGVAEAIELVPEATVHITRNRFTNNQAGIVSSRPLDIPAPRIEAVASDSVTGSCSVAGTVELFADDGDQGETFLGQAPCLPPDPWRVSISGPPVGRNLTAILTSEAGDSSAFSPAVPVAP